MATQTADELTTQVRQDLAAEGVSQVWIRRTFEAALARVLGPLLWVFYAWIDGLAKQATPAHATGPFLDAWAAIFGMARIAAGTARGDVILTGTMGDVQPAGSAIVGPEGQLYTTDVAVTIGGIGAALAAITASASGPMYNLAEGAACTVSSPGSGIASACAVSVGGIAGGRATESDDDLRARLLPRIQRPAETGLAGDYLRWTREASTSVSRAWCYERGREGNEPGVVLVMFAVSGAAPIPSGGLVTTVTNYLALKRPAGMILSVLAPTGQAVPLTIALDPSQDTTANRALVSASLVDMFATSSPGVVMSNLSLNVALVRAGIPYQLQSVKSGAGSADVTPISLLRLLYLGTITWGVWV